MFASLNSFCPSAYTFLFRISPLISEVENISGDPRLFPATFLPKYLTGCISHCCIIGNHGIDVHHLIPKSNEWCKYHTYRCLKNACHIWVPQLFKIKPWYWLVWLSRLRRNRKIIITRSWSLPMSASEKFIVLWMLTPDRKRVINLVVVFPPGLCLVHLLDVFFFFRELEEVLTRCSQKQIQNLTTGVHPIH